MTVLLQYKAMTYNTICLAVFLPGKLVNCVPLELTNLERIFSVVSLRMLLIIYFNFSGCSGVSARQAS